MELLQLKYFCDAAETENLTATAKKFYVPASAVSQSIKRLERELSVTLFTRQANSIKLNDKGRLFYEDIKKALSLINDGEKKIRDDGQRGRIKISVFINRRIVMQTVEKFSKLYPGVDIVIKYNVYPDSEDFDIVVTDEALKGNYGTKELLRENIVLAVKKDNPLSSLDNIRREELEGEPFVCTNKGSSLYRITQNLCNKMGFSPRIVICSDDPYYIRKCIEFGLGVSFIPERSWQGQFSDNILLKKATSYERITYLYQNTRKYTSKCVERFIEMLTEEGRAEEF